MGYAIDLESARATAIANARWFGRSYYVFSDTSGNVRVGREKPKNVSWVEEYPPPMETNPMESKTDHAAATGHVEYTIDEITPDRATMTCVECGARVEARQ